ncbi:MAG: outer membrane beta-barrel protein [Gammaproteobacteria bacterium]|nr:outer membrane beta-barrel protein [Gammaproteobacteria bacterium]
MKKLYPSAAFILTLLASSAYASGFYTGVTGGYDSTDFYKTLTIDENNAQIYDKQDNLAGKGFFGGALLGYRFDIGRGFIATELDGNLSSMKYNGWFVDNTVSPGQTSTATLSINKSYGISLSPGYYINSNVALYGRIGFERGDFQYSESKATLGNASYGITENQWLNGWKVGAGLLTALTPRLDLRLEYDHIRYDTYTNTTFPLEPGQYRTMKLSPESNQFQLGLIYKFS